MSVWEKRDGSDEYSEVTLTVPKAKDLPKKPNTTDSFFFLKKRMGVFCLLDNKSEGY